MSPEDQSLAGADDFDREVGRLDTFLKKLFSSGEKSSLNESPAGARKPSPDSSDFADQDEQELSFLEPGERVGCFKIVRLIGYGGFGVVYRAVDEEASLDVALKLPRRDRLNSAQVLKRFHREARLARGLDHESIVRVIETNVEGDTFYIASEFQNGPNLKQWVAEHPGPVPMELVVGWAVQLADALQYAFLNGIVHRDMKPTNIMIVPGQDGAALRPRITDFGLAYSVNDPVSSTSASGILLGTPGYMAPEQVLSGMNRVDIRADIYALGLILAELLAGVRIRKYEHLMEFVVHLTKNDPSRDLDLLKKQIPADLHAILSKSIEVEPHKRYQTPGDFRDDLERFRKGQPTLARPLSRRERVVRFMRRKPYQAALVLVSCLFISYFLANRFAQQRELSRVNDSLTEMNTTLKETLEKLQGKQKELTRQIYNSNIRQAYSEFRDGHVEAAQDILDTTRRMKYNPTEPLAEFSWRYLSKLARDRHSGHRAAEFDTYLPEPYGTRYRQIYEKHKEVIDSRGMLFGEMDVTDRLLYARSGFQQMLMDDQPLMKYLTDPLSGAMETTLGEKLEARTPAFLVAPTTRQRLQLRTCVIPLKDRTLLSQEFARNILHDTSGNMVMPFNIDHYIPVFSMNGEVVLGLCAFEMDGAKRLEWVGYDFKTGEPIDFGIQFKSGSGKPQTSAMPSIGQVGQGVLCYDNIARVISLYDRTTRVKKELLNWNMQPGEVVPLSMVLDESRNRFFVGDSSNRIRAWRIGEVQPFAEYPNRIATLSDVGLLPGGLVCGRIAYSDRVWVWDPEQKPEQNQKLNLTDEVWSLAFDPSGEFLVGCGDDNRGHVWNLKTGDEKLLEKHESLVSCGRFSADGSRFASCDFSGWLRIWNTSDWSLERKEKIASDKLRALAWGPDNQTIVAVGNGKSAWGWLSGDVKVRPLPVDDISHDIVYLKKFNKYVVAQNGLPSALRFLSSPGLVVEKEVTMNRRPLRLAVSPDESLLVAGFHEGGFEVYHTGTYQLIKSVGKENSAGAVKSLAFLKDGKNLIVSGGDNRLTIYETETWEPIGTMMEHASQVNAMAVSADGSQFASGDMAGRIIVRKTNP